MTIKEVFDGYYSFRTHSIVNMDAQGNKAEQHYRIGQDLTIHMRREEVLSVDAKETEYNIHKDDGTWTVIKPDGEQVDIANFKPYDIINNNDGTITYKLY
jgi:hypothetical protein